MDAPLTDIAVVERASEAPPVANLPQEWRLLPHLDAQAIGTRLPDGSVSVRRAEPAGCFLFGPYWHFPAGRYRLAVEGSARRVRFAAAPVLGVEILVLNLFQRAWRDFTIAELGAGRAELIFDIPPDLAAESGNEARFEFRFFHLGNADFRLTAVDLRSVPENEAAEPDPHRWRLLGRLSKGWTGFRQRSGAVAARRYAPARPLLYGGWPYLRLTSGPYRLTLRYRAGRMPRGDRPVLAVEAIGGSRWRSGRAWPSVASRLRSREVRLARREFAAAELPLESITLDFMVPPELGLETGGNAPIEIRVHHFGNNELTIEAVDLQALDAGEAVVRTADSGRSGARSSERRATRTKIVFLGNCQCRLLSQMFENDTSLSRRYEASYHFIPVPPNLQPLALSDLESSDIVLAQDIHLWDEFDLKDSIRPGAEIVRFPFLRFASPWPFDGWNGPTDREAIERESPNLTFAYLDGLLARLRKEIPDPAARFAAYRALDCPGVINYRRLHELEIRRLQAMDRKFDTEIGAFILDNFRKRRLFHATVRPDWYGHNLLLRSILRSLGLKPVDLVRRKADAMLRSPQVPVHPKVAHDLGILWADESTRYFNHGSEIDWESYVRRYIAHYG